MPEPLVPDVGVIALVADRWNDLWQPRHCVLSRLCRYFHVAWVNPTGEWRDVLRHPRRFTGLDRHPAQNLTVGSPDFLLPTLYKPPRLAEAFDRARLARARRSLLRKGCRRIVLYVWRPRFHTALDRVEADLRCYHVDDDYSFSMDGREELLPEDLSLLERSDQVFIHSPGLLEKKGRINPHTAFVPNGVDYDAYSTPAPEPEDLAGIPHPRIGYTGQIKQELDWELLGALADRNRRWSFVMVGPVNDSHGIDEIVAGFDARPNVWMLGGKAPRDLCRYPQHFDVCIMPYALNSFTSFIYPMKLHEYLASGRPVVGAPIRSLEPFAHVVRLPKGLEEWSSALAGSLEPEESSEDRCAERRAVARIYDWDALVARIATAMAGRLGDGRRERLQSSLDPSLRAASEAPLAESGLFERPPERRV